MIENFFGKGFGDPWSELSRLQDEVNELFSRSRPRGVLARQAATDTFPPLNVWSGEDKLMISAELPGIDPKELDISVHENVLTLKGRRPLEELKEGEAYLRQERPFGQFVRSFELPYRVDPEKVQAEYAKGVLTVSLARHEEDKPRRINVKIN